MERERLRGIKAHYLLYRNDRKKLHERCRQNRLWYMMEQDEFGKGDAKANGTPASRSGHIFNAIQYKHADFMDSYPHINILPREESDKEEADTLSGIIPFILDNCKFKKTYSGNSYEKLICGTSVYGVFYDASLSNGKGDISIEQIELTRLSFQPGITDINDSKYVFYDSFMDIDEFRAVYGADRKNIQTQSSYDDVNPNEDSITAGEMVVITDCYYKVTKSDGSKVLHFLKFTGDEVLEETEGKQEYKNGLYEHGRYPFVFDVLHSVNGDICGNGIVDIAKNQQAYIDKLDDIINTNALISGIPRYFISNGAGVNEQEFLNLENTLVHTSGNTSEDVIKYIRQANLPAYISTHRKEKIEELKEIVGNRDFSQGGTSGGVTAASAITALQNSGDKLSRDMIQSTYDAFTDIIWLVIELVREFYTEERTFRILGDDAKESYIRYSNANIRPQPDDEGIRALEEYFMAAEIGGDFPEIQYKKPLFDISLSVEKNNPYQRGQHNELILALFNMGLFHPQNAELGLFVISNLNFDGRDKILGQLEGVLQKKQMQEQQTKERQMPMAQSAVQSVSGVLSPETEGLPIDVII